MPELGKTLAATRKDYCKHTLLREDLTKNPFDFFHNWMEEALLNDPMHANAMVLSTIGEDEMPDSRVVLLKDLNQNGFSFYTNYASKKGKDLEKYPKAALLFFWQEFERQVRISGTIERLSLSAADDYFASRPFESKVGAYASQQSTVIESREVLDEAFESAMQQFSADTNVPRPAHWGGYILIPQRIEFWQGRSSRLHDRFRYRKDTTTQQWIIERLMP
jgi:pyridoxamine 5'-phosphate oxidase